MPSLPRPETFRPQALGRPSRIGPGGYGSHGGSGMLRAVACCVLRAARPERGSTPDPTRVVQTELLERVGDPYALPRPAMAFYAGTTSKRGVPSPVASLIPCSPMSFHVPFAPSWPV